MRKEDIPQRSEFKCNYRYLSALAQTVPSRHNTNRVMPSDIPEIRMIKGVCKTCVFKENCDVQYGDNFKQRIVLCGIASLLCRTLEEALQSDEYETDLPGHASISSSRLYAMLRERYGKSQFH